MDRSVQEADARQATGGALASAGFYVAGVLLGLALFVAAFPTGVLSSVGILFYRGLALILLVAAVHAALMVLVLRRLRRTRSPLARGGHLVVPVVTLAAALNLTFFVLLPVNLDRSISVFLLSWMRERGEAPAAEGDLVRAFERIYIERYGAMDRRIAEQLASGNIVATPEGFRLTERGQAFVAFARFVGGIFSVDPRFLYPPQEVAEVPPGDP